MPWYSIYFNEQNINVMQCSIPWPMTTHHICNYEIRIFFFWIYSFENEYHWIVVEMNARHGSVPEYSFEA